MDVLTCVDEVCDTSKAPKDRFWQYGDLAAGTPEAHRCTITLIDGYYQQQEAWSCPGKRRILRLLSKRYACNHSVRLLSKEAQC